MSSNSAQKNLPLLSHAPLLDAYRDAFEQWASDRRTMAAGPADSRKLGLNTADIYREMWQAFAAFCVARGTPFAKSSIADLESFLSARAVAKKTSGSPKSTAAISVGLSPRYARRFLSLVDKVFRHQARIDGVPPNISAYELMQRPDFRYAESSDKDPLPDYLDEPTADRLIAFVAGDNTANPDDRLPWKVARDRTAVALMLGAGLAPGDIRNLRLDGVIAVGGKVEGLPWKLSVPGNGNAPARETPISTWAAYQLVKWLDLRKREQIQGDFVFPSTLGGKQWSHTRCYESCTAVLSEASIKESAGGLFKLRHTFALRQLASGVGEVEVARWLGLLDANGMARYRRILQGEVTAV